MPDPNPTEPGSPVADVATLLEQHRYDDALALLDRAIAEGPKDPGLLERKLALLYELGRLHDAMAVGRELARRDPSGEWLVRLARMHARCHDDFGAADLLAASLQRQPVPFDRALFAAGNFASTERYDDGLAALHDAVRAPGVAAEQRLFAAQQFIALGDLAAAEEQLQLAAAVQAGEARLQQARLCLWRNEVAAAAAMVTDLVAGPRPPATALVIRGVARLRHGDLAAAEADFSAAIAADPAEPTAWCWRAETRLRAGVAGEALADATYATDLPSSFDPFVVNLLRVLANIEHERVPHIAPFVLEPLREGLIRLCPGCEPALGRGDPREIAALIWTALDRLGGNRSPTPTMIEADGSLSRLRLRASPRWRASWALATIQTAGVDEARRRLDAVVADSPGSPIALCYRGELDLYLGDYAAAGGFFRRAIAADETTRWAYIGSMAVALFTEGPEAAIALWERALPLAQSPGPTLFGYRGEAYRRAGQLDLAVAELEHSVRTSPTRIGSWLNLGLAHLAAGSVAGLHAALDEVKRRAPGFVTDAAGELAIPVWRADPLPADAAAALCEHMLAMLRGNRGSTYVSYFTRAGALRFVPRTD
ncbi:tetratricopeptide repeat protein [bacterium]|nr:tetratricopeptide repeat protein [bacterium]